MRVNTTNPLVWIRRAAPIGWGLILIVLIIPGLAYGTVSQVGTFEIEANYSHNGTKLTFNVENSSTARRNSMKCFSLRDTSPGAYRIAIRPRSGWYFPDHFSACAVFSGQFIHSGTFTYDVNPDLETTSSLTVAYINRAGERHTGEVQADGLTLPNEVPVANAGQDRVVEDSDGLPGELVTLDASLSSDDKAIVGYSWYDNGILVAQGKLATLFMDDLTSSTLELVVVDIEGETASDVVVITVADFAAPYNGVSPNPDYQLEFNNIGTYNESTATVHLCVSVPESDAPGAESTPHNLNLSLAGMNPVRFNVAGFSEFNPLGLLNQDGELPDCSGQYEVATGRLSDIVQVGSLIGELSLVYESNPFPVMRVVGFEWLVLDSQ